MNIKICDRCEGTGKINETDIFGDLEFLTCKKCKGSGRLYTRTFTLTIPYPVNKTNNHPTNYPNGYIELDTEIINKIRLFEKKCNEDF